jgi:sugar lactone lactonase YvrE
VELDQPLGVTGSVTNAGNATAPAFVTAVVLSADQAIGGVDPVLGTVPCSGLGAGLTFPISASFAVPASVAPADYYVGLRVDAFGDVAESDETNNTTSTASTLAVVPAAVKRPNLVARSLTAPATLRAGDPFTATASVDNAGSLDVTSTFTLEFSLSADLTLDPGDPRVGTDTVPGLAAGGSAVRQPSLAVPGALAAGAYRLFLAVDPLATLDDTSRSDNVVSAGAASTVTSRPADTTPPTATLAYSPGRNLTAAGPLTITVTFSEPLGVTPQLQLASTGGRLLGGAMGPDPSDTQGLRYLLRLTLAEADNGTYTLTLTARDRSANSLVTQPTANSLTVAIVANRAPVVDAGSDRSVTVGTLVQLSATASDADGDALTFAWTAPANVTLAGPTTLTPSFTPATAGRYPLVLTVSDARGARTTDTVTIEAASVNSSVQIDQLQLSGIVRLESGEFPASGSQVRVTNPARSLTAAGPIDAGSGYFLVTLTDPGLVCAAASGDLLEFSLFNPDGTSRRIVRPQPATRLVVDDDLLAQQGELRLDLTGEGSLASGGVLLTVAGTGTAGFSGDGSAATSAALNVPTGLAFDSQGNLFIADTGNYRIRRVTPAGVASTVAGNGKGEASGDGGLATQAGLGQPFGVAVTADGTTLFVSDRAGHRVRRIDLTSNRISTLAGTGVGGYSGDSGQAAAAQLRQPRGLALRGTTTLLVADTGNHRIREIDLSATTIRTVAGSGTAGSSGDGGQATAAALLAPAGLVLDSDGRLLVTELSGHRVRRIDLGSGVISAVAGTGTAGSAGDGGPATAAQLAGPAALAFGAPGVVVAEKDGHRLRLIPIAGGTVRTLAGTGQPNASPDGTTAERAALWGPQGVAFEPVTGEVVFADTGTHRVRRLRVPGTGGTDDHPDSAAQTASKDEVTANGAPAAGALESGGDVDFFRFAVVPGQSYTLATELVSLDDTVLTLYDTDGQRVLDENDDAGGSRASSLSDFRPQQEGTYYARVRAFSERAVGAYRLTLRAQALSTEPLIVTTGLPDAGVAQSYGFTLAAAGGQSPYQWTLVDGALPAGLSLEGSSGLVVGTATLAGDFRFAVTAKDAGGRSATRSFALAVRPPGTIGLPVSQHPYAAASDEQLSFRLPGNPAALEVSFDERTFVEAGFDFLHVLDGSGRPITGSPFTGSALAGRTVRVPGDTVLLRLVSDVSVTGWGYAVTRVAAASGTVADTLTIGPSALPAARRGQSYAAQLTATEASAPLAWSIDPSSPLPPGLLLDTASGALSGQTTATGEFQVTVRLNDAASRAGSRRFLLPVFAVGGAVLPESRHPYSSSGDERQSYTVANSPGAILVSFDALTELESGFDFLYVTGAEGTGIPGSPFSARELAGRTIRVPGDTVRLRLVSDAATTTWGYRVTRIVAAPATPPPLAWVTPGALSGSRVGMSTAAVLVATGGLEPYRYSAVSGRLPPGVALETQGGRLVGVPANSGNFSFRLQVTDSAWPAALAEQTFTLPVAQAAPPVMGLAAGAQGDGCRAIVRLDTVPEPLSRAKFTVSYDEMLLENPRATAAAAAGGAAVQADLLASGLLTLLVMAPPLLSTPGELAWLDFDALGPVRPGLVTILSSELLSSEGQVLLLRPTADAGIEQNVFAHFTAPGVLSPTVPDPLAPPASNGRSFVRLDSRQSVDPNRPVLPLSYSWAQTSGTTVTLSSLSSAVPTFVPPREGEYAFSLVVSNGQFASPADEVRVVVNGVNAVPVAQPVVTGTGAGGFFVAGRDPVTLDGTLSTDRDADDLASLTYRWRQTSGAPVELTGQGASSLTTPLLRFVPRTPGRLAFELVVTDRQGAASAPAAVEVRVRRDQGQPPRLSLVASATTTSAQGSDLGDDSTQKNFTSLRVRMPTRVSLKALVDDPDVGRPPLKESLSFEWKQTAGPAVQLQNAVQARGEQVVSVAAFEPTTARVYEFECQVREYDEAGNGTAEVARQLRVVVDSPEVVVPQAAVVARVARPSSKAWPGTGGKAGWELVSLPSLQPGESRNSSGAPQVSQVQSGDRVTLDGSASVRSEQEPLAPLTYRWRQVSGPDVELSNPFSSVTTFVVPEVRGDSRQRLITFQLFVDDGRARSEPAATQVLLAPPGRVRAPMQLQHGLNLLSVPVDPSTTGRPFTADDVLTRLVGSRTGGLVVRVAPTGPGGAGQFEVYHPTLKPSPFAIGGNEGDLVLHPSSAVTRQLEGQPWGVPSLTRTLHRGLNLVALPAGIPSGYDSARLAAAAHSPYVVRLGANGRFQVHLLGVSSPFELRSGAAYLIHTTAPGTLVLPQAP